MCAPLETVGKVSVWNGHHKRVTWRAASTKEGAAVVHKIGTFGAHSGNQPPSFARPPAITIEYVDLESSIKLSALRERAQRVI